MKFLILICLFASQVWAHEKAHRSDADKFAFARFSSQKNHPWPFPLLSIGHNMQSYQNYGGSPYWHDGLDIRSNVSEAIYAAAGGKVVNVENYNTGDLYWEVAILDEEGFVWKYHHVDKKSIPQDIKDAFKKGQSVAAGAYLGNVVKWPVSSYGEVYHHLHLLVVAKDGQYINPLLMMEPLVDTQAPVIERIGIVKNHKSSNLTSVKGAHALFVEASDLILHNKFIVPPHKISYRLDKGEENVVWEFIHLPSKTNDTDFINDFYLSDTCGNYSCRKLLFNLNFTQENPRGLMTLPKGEHEVEVTVSDIVGNETSKSFKWEVE